MCAVFHYIDNASKQNLIENNIKVNRELRID